MSKGKYTSSIFAQKYEMDYSLLSCDTREKVSTHSLLFST